MGVPRNKVTYAMTSERKIRCELFCKNPKTVPNTKPIKLEQKAICILTRVPWSNNGNVC